MEIFSERLKEQWDTWEIRSLVILSLLLQIILIIFGSRRKITNRHSRIGILLNVTIWCAYIAADWVTTVALCVMAFSRENCQYDSSKASNRLHAFWAPFLLLHLGGPDTITAFSTEDNDLWVRRLLGVIVEVGLAFYAFIRFWSTNALTFLAIPVFITGIVKCGERTWVLRSSRTQFNDSRGSFPSWLDRARINAIRPEDRNLADGYWLYHILRCNVILGHPYIHVNEEDSYRMITGKSAEDAFRVVATEVGVLYDVFYTKANIVYSRPGIFLHCCSFICSIAALFLFFIIIDVRSYQKFDVLLTYVLLVGAVVLETYAFIMLLSSDWTKLWLISFRIDTDNQISRTTLVDGFQRLTNCLHSRLTAKKRWSESIGQYDLMRSVDEERQRTCVGLEKLSCTSKLLGKYKCLSWENVDISLQQTIFNHLKGVADELHLIRCDPFDFRRSRDEYLSRRGEYALRDYVSLGKILDVEDYDAKVIMWHIATNECYETELKHRKGNANELTQDCKIGKWISDYMVYLLLFCPSIFPKGIGQLRYEHTYNHMADPSGSLHPTDYSVLDKANVLAACLAISVEDHNRRWEVIIKVWLELLLHVASYFEWKEHTQYLRKGGELLTLISVLMINFRLSKQMT